MVWGFDAVWIVVLYVYSVNSGNDCCSFCVRFCSDRIIISAKQENTTLSSSAIFNSSISVRRSYISSNFCDIT